MVPSRSKRSDPDLANPFAGLDAGELHGVEAFKGRQAQERARRRSRWLLFACVVGCTGLGAGIGTALASDIALALPSIGLGIGGATAGLLLGFVGGAVAFAGRYTVTPHGVNQARLDRDAAAGIGNVLGGLLTFCGLGGAVIGATVGAVVGAGPGPQTLAGAWAILGAGGGFAVGVACWLLLKRRLMRLPSGTTA